MTRAKFKRLFIVLLAPLLIAGGILAFSVNMDDGSINLRCNNSLFGMENCRSTGWGDFADRVEKESPAWFEVNARPYEKNSFPRVTAYASQRQIDGVELIDATPYVGTAEGPGSPLSELQSLAGQKISILFGVSNERDRTFNPLGCNQLDFDEASPSVFTAGLCGIPNGVAQVRFRVGPEAQKALAALKSSIDDETARGRTRMIENYVFITPIFLIVFLIISGVVWAIRRAARYVAAA